MGDQDEVAEEECLLVEFEDELEEWEEWEWEWEEDEQEEEEEAEAETGKRMRNGGGGQFERGRKEGMQTGGETNLEWRVRD